MIQPPLLMRGGLGLSGGLLILLAACSTPSDSVPSGVNQPVAPSNRTTVQNPDSSATRSAGRHGAHLPPLSAEQFGSFQLAIADLIAGRTEQAAEGLEGLLRSGRNDEWVLHAHGVALLQLGHATAAALSVSRALDLYADNERLHFTLALTYLAQGKSAQAIPYLEGFLRSSPRTELPLVVERAAVELAQAYRQAGRLDDCERMLTEVGRAVPSVAESPWVLDLLAECAFDRGNDARYHQLSMAAEAALQTRLQRARPRLEVEWVTPPIGARPPTTWRAETQPAVSDNLATSERSNRHGTSGTTAEVSAETLAPSFQATGSYRLPLDGAVELRRGPNSELGHRGVRYRFAFDFLPLNAALKPGPPSGDVIGLPVRDWAGFGAIVVAARAGVVTWVEDEHPDQTTTGIPTGMPFVPANRIAIRHANGEISLYLHLQQASATVSIGQQVEAGQPIGRLGCSGTRVMVPHLQFAVLREVAQGLAYGVQVHFVELERWHETAWQPLAAAPALNDVLRHRP